MRSGAGRAARRLLLVLCLSSGVPGAATPAGGALVRLGEPVMGTVLTVTVVAGDDHAARLLAEAAVTQARHWDDVLTTWRPDGELAQLNARRAAGRWT
ncbi:MAG: hypothetical protein U0802_00905 [Candidatus Binatia bacterium]